MKLPVRRTINTSAGSTATPSETEFACVSLRHWEGDLPQAKIPTGLIKAKATAQFARLDDNAPRLHLAAVIPSTLELW